jgi:acetoin utilization protein AcuB
MATIGDFMTKNPRTIRHDQTVGEARQLMEDFRIRHLIVMSGTDLAGIVSQRDLDAIQRGCRLDESALLVEEAMMPVAYKVKQSVALKEVAGTMAERRIGSALIVDDQERCVGLFTTIDALRALARVGT